MTVCSDLEALQDVVEDGVNGLVTAAGDDRKLVEALRRLTADDTLAGQLARTGREVALKRFDWETVASDYRRHYETLVEGGADS